MRVSDIPLSQDLDWDWAVVEAWKWPLGELLLCGCVGAGGHCHKADVVDPWSREQRGLEHYPALPQCPLGRWQGLWAVKGHHPNHHSSWIRPVSSLGLWVDTHYWFLQSRRTSFSVHGGTTSLHPASGFLWMGVQVKITQGVTEPLISEMRLLRMERGDKCLPGLWGRSQHLDVEARDSSIIATHSYTWNGNITFLDPDHPVEGPSLEHLAAPAYQGPAEGDHAHEEEWPQVHLLLCEVA